jgi:multiple sugar transport system permease protein
MSNVLVSTSATARRRTRMGRKLKARRVGLAAGMVAVVLWTMLPLIYLVVLSVKPEDLMLGRPSLAFYPTVTRYQDLLRWDRLGEPIWNSLVTSGLGTLGAVILGGMAAVSLSLATFRGKGAVFFMVLLTRMYPAVTTVIPIYLVIRTLGLVDTLAALVLLFIGFQIPLVMWILYTFLQTLPRELVEAASLDGASLTVIALRIILPLSAPGLASAAILSFIFNWNEFLFPLVLTSFNAKTGAVAIMNYIESEKDVLWGPLSTVGVAMTIPVILFMVLLRSHLVRGLTAGMLKD